MNPRKYLFQSIVLAFLFIAGSAIAAHAQSFTINGTVFDAQTRRPVGDLYVELQSFGGRSFGRVRVEPSGRFVFRLSNPGTYTVKVLTLGTNYLETSQEVELRTFPLGGGRFSSDQVFVDFQLKLDPRKINVGSGGAPTVVFAQDVPDEARKLFKKAVEQLGDKKDTGLDSLKQALEIFPNYYDALDLLGTEYVRRQQYIEGVPFLLRAIDVNQRSYSSYYALGIASYSLKDIQAAIKALRAAVTINPLSIQAQVFYGMVLRINGDFAPAEKALLEAKKLTEDRTPFAEVHRQLGLLYNETGRYKEAADELERYLKVAPKGTDKEAVKKQIAELRAKAK